MVNAHNIGPTSINLELYMRKGHLDTELWSVLHYLCHLIITNRLHIWASLKNWSDLYEQASTHPVMIQ